MIKFDKKFIFLFFGRFLQAGLAVISVRLMTEFLSIEEVGNQYLINSILLWFSLVLINPVGMYVNRHLNEWKSESKIGAAIKKLNLYFIAVAILSLPAIFFIKSCFDVATGIYTLDLMLFALCYIFISTWFQTLVSFFNLLEMQKAFVFLNVFSLLVGLLLSYLMVVFIQASALVWMSGLLVGQFVALLLALYLFKRRFPEPLSGRFVFFEKATLLFCYPIALTTLFMWFLNQGYRLLVEKNLGAQALGSLGVGLGLATSLAGVVEAITTQYLYPQYYASLVDSSASQRSTAWLRLWKSTMVIYVSCSFLMASICFLIMRVLTAESFHHAWKFFLFGCAIELFRQCSNIAYLVSHAEKKTHRTILPYSLGALALLLGLMILQINLIFNISNILQLLLFSGFLTFALNMYSAKKQIQAHLDFKLVLRALALSFPLLLPLVFFDIDSSFIVLIISAFASVFWGIFILYYQLQKNLIAD